MNLRAKLVDGLRKPKTKKKKKNAGTREGVVDLRSKTNKNRNTEIERERVIKTKRMTHGSGSVATIVRGYECCSHSDWTAYQPMVGIHLRSIYSQTTWFSTDQAVSWVSKFLHSPNVMCNNIHYNYTIETKQVTISKETHAPFSGI